MLPVSQGWKNAQSLQLRPEGDVKIEFFTSSDLTNPVATINKDHISAFNYRGSGKVDNANVPSLVVNLELIKGTHGDIQRGYIAKLYFGFLINDAWEYIEANWFKVDEVNIPANGLVDKFVLKPISAESYSKQYTRGSNGGDLDPIGLVTRVTGYSPTALVPVDMSAFTDLASFDDVFVGMSLGNCSKIEALQLIGIACGKTLIVDKTLHMTFQSSQIPVGASDVKYKTITPNASDANFDYVINPTNSYKFPELQNNMAVSHLIVTQYTNTLGDVAHTYNEVFTSIQSRSWDKQFQELYYKITYSVKAGSFSPNSLFTGVRLDGYVAKWWALNLTAPARMEVYLYTMATTAEQKSYTINASVGEDFYVDNPLVNENYITPCKDYLVAWLPFQNYIECEYRIDPRVELFDKIVVVDKSNHVNIVVVEDYTIEFNGGFTGKARGRVVETLDDILPVTILDYGEDDEFDLIHIHNPNNYKVSAVIHLSTGQLDTKTINANSTILVWTDSDNKAMQQEKGRMMNGTLTTDTYVETKMFDLPSVVAEEHTGIFFVLNAPVITRNVYNASGQFAVDVYNPNNCDVKMYVSYSSGTLEFDIPANSTLTLTQANAGVLTDSAMEKAYGNLMHTVDCQFVHNYPNSNGGVAYTQSTGWTVIWEADEL